MNARLSKAISGVLTLIMLTLLLSACGSNSGNTEKTGEGNTTQEQSGDAADLSATIKIWDWDEAFQKEMIPEFNKKYPNIKVELTVVNTTDYLQKLQSGIASGSDVPDIILGEMAYRGKLFDLDVLDNLENAPYNFKKDQLLDYLVPVLSNSKGELVGIDQMITPAGFAFRCDLAKEYLGTDQPEELEALLSDWNSFIAKGKEIKEKSGGTVTMLPGLGDAYLVLRGQNSEAYIEGNTIDLTSKMQGTLENLFEMRDAGILGKNELWTPSWSASMAKGQTLFYPMAPWGPKWHISANDPEGSGRWGLIKAPEASFMRGGTAIGIYKDSKEKEAAWAFLNFAYLSDEGTVYSFKNFGNMPGIKSFFENHQALLEEGTEYDAFFGGQNLSQYYVNKIIPDIKGEPQTKYDSIVEGAFNALYPLWTKDTSIDAAAALAKFKEEVKNKAGDAVVQ